VSTASIESLLRSVRFAIDELNRKKKNTRAKDALKGFVGSGEICNCVHR